MPCKEGSVYFREGGMEVIIKEIRIYGYGKLENVVFKNLHQLTVFFGENEAGKSTIMSFIHSILFGFPTRQQAELRYEPKFHSKYGGMLIVHFSNIGIVTIERVKGKSATGDVTVTFADGTTGAEVVLNDLLKQMDRHTFRSIYSFNIHQLQHAQQMRNDELNKFLFSSSAVGTDQLMKVEALLQKELDDRFKQRGKKPYLNRMLSQLRDQHHQLKKAKQQNEQYVTFLRDKAELEKTWQQLLEKESTLLERKQLLHEWEKLQPILTEAKQIEAELMLIDNVVFPHDGKNRMDQLQQLFIPYETQTAGKKSRLQLLKSELEKYKPDEQMLDLESEITMVTESLPLYEKMKLEEREQEEKIVYLKAEIALLRDQFHLHMTEEELMKINTSVLMKDKVKAINRNSQRILDQKLTLDNRFNEEKDKLEQLEKEKEQLERESLSAADRKRLEEKLTEAENRQQLQEEYDYVGDKLAFLFKAEKQAAENNQKMIKQQSLQTILFTTLFMIFIVVGLMNQQYVISIGAVIGLSLFLFMNKDKVKGKQDAHQRVEIATEIATLKEKQQLLSEKLAEITNVPLQNLKNQLEKDIQLREQLRYVKMKFEQQLTDYDAVITMYEKWEYTKREIEQSVAKITKDWGISEQISSAHLLSIFETIEQLKKWYRERRQTNEQLLELTKKRIEIENRMLQIAKACRMNTNLSIYEIATELKRRLKKELEKQVVFKEKRTKIIELEDECQQLSVEQTRLQKRMNELLHEAQVDNLDQYYKVGEKASQRKQLSNRLKELTRLIDQHTIESILKYFPGLSTRGEGESKLQQCKIQLADVRQQMEACQSRLAEVKHEMNILEEGGTYSNILHQFRQQLAVFNDEAKVWARYAIAQDLLIKTIDCYKRDRLPKVLEKAGGYLQHLTNEEYQNIVINDEKDHLIIIRKDYAQFHPKELSQATAEQVYVSMRLALATTLGKQSRRYPIIIDDSFVNFDASRVNQMIDLLHEIALEHQVIFFTCHHHIASQFNNKNILRLSKHVSDSIMAQ